MDRTPTAKRSDVALVLTTSEGAVLEPEVKTGKHPSPRAVRPANDDDEDLLRVPRKSAKPTEKKSRERRKSREFTEAEAQIIKETFNLFDRNRDGHVSCSELGDLLRSLGQNPTEAEINAFITIIDVNGNGKFDLNDFSKLLTNHMKGQEEMERELRQSFIMFDLNRDGYVTADELRKAMISIGEIMTVEEVNELFQMCDLNKDGKIDYDEFVKAMTSDALFK